MESKWLRKIRKQSDKMKGLSFFEFLILRVLKRNSDTTMFDLGLYLGRTRINKQQLKKLLNKLEKNGLVAWTLTDIIEGDLKQEAVGKKIFSLTETGLIVLKKANQLLRTH